MRKHVALILLISILLTICGCTTAAPQNCNHNYYLSDYVEASNMTNGHKHFTCSNCGHSYDEVIPKKDPSSNPSEKTEPTQVEEDPTRKRSVKLFDYPMYSNHDVITGVVDLLKYCSEETDVDGWKHTDCYKICGSTTDAWIRYEINGNFSTVSGRIFDFNNSGGSGWLEFYDGEDFLASTKKVGDGVSSIEFEFDIAGVKYLTVYFRATSAGTWMIADDIMMTK